MESPVTGFDEKNGSFTQKIKSGHLNIMDTFYLIDAVSPRPEITHLKLPHLGSRSSGSKVVLSYYSLPYVDPRNLMEMSCINKENRLLHASARCRFRIEKVLIDGGPGHLTRNLFLPCLARRN